MNKTNYNLLGCACLACIEVILKNTIKIKSISKKDILFLYEKSCLGDEKRRDREQKEKKFMSDTETVAQENNFRRSTKCFTKCETQRVRRKIDSNGLAGRQNNKVVA